MKSADPRGHARNRGFRGSGVRLPYMNRNPKYLDKAQREQQDKDARARTRGRGIFNRDVCLLSLALERIEANARIQKA